MKQFPFLLLFLTGTILYAQPATDTHYSSLKKNSKKESILNSPASTDSKQQAQTLPDKRNDTPDRYTVTTIAGQNTAGNVDGQGSTALLSSPSSVAVDAKGNLYIADAINNKIRKISPNGLVSTFAGKQTAGKKDGAVSEATFYYPAGIAIDSRGNLYVADKGNHVIRKITAEGVVSTLAGSGVRNSLDGPPAKACFDKPVAVAVDTMGNVYVADAANHKIRKISPLGTVSTLAGNGELGSQDGKGAAASFYNPSGIAVDAAGNVYVADRDNNRIRKITPDGTVSTLAGSDTIGNKDGQASEATFFNPSNLAVDAVGNLFITDQVNHEIRKLSPSGDVTTLAGSGIAGAADGIASMASFNYPSGIAVDGSGNLYVADQLNCKVRKIIPLSK